MKASRPSRVFREPACYVEWMLGASHFEGQRFVGAAFSLDFYLAG